MLPNLQFTFGVLECFKTQKPILYFPVLNELLYIWRAEVIYRRLATYSYLINNPMLNQAQS